MNPNSASDCEEYFERLREDLADEPREASPLELGAMFGDGIGFRSEGDIDIEP
jgi:hypothetical protein